MQTLDLALVQLENGTTATPFEFRPPSVELSLAQRYYEKNDPNGYDNTLTAYYTRLSYLKRPMYLLVAKPWNPYMSFSDNSTQITSAANASNGPITSTWREGTDSSTGMKSSIAYWWAEAEYPE